MRAGSQLLLYVNGELAGSTEITEAPDYSRVGFVPTIAGNSGSGADNYGGLVDDLRIYNRALSSNEVPQLYALELCPILNIRKAVYLDSTDLWAGSNYRIRLREHAWLQAALSAVTGSRLHIPSVFPPLNTLATGFAVA